MTSGAHLARMSRYPSASSAFKIVLCPDISFHRVLTDIYSDDKAKYGDPADSTHTTVDISFIPEWQKTLGKHAAKVSIVPRGEAKKCNFSEMNDENSGAGEGSGDGPGGSGTGE